MRATPQLFRKGFVGRSIDELKRYSNIIWNLEAIKGVSGPMALHDFHTADTIQDCKLMSDEILSGYSKAALDWVPPGTSKDGNDAKPLVPGHARFHGRISTALPPHRPDVHRSGFAAWRTRDRPPTIFGKSLWNIDMYIYLALRIKSDGRSYLVNVQTESVEPTDLHQHRLFAKRPGEWETVMIKWNDFVRTNHGFVVEPQAELLRQKVKSIGVGLTDRVPGPFELCIERMWATNNIDEADNDEQATVREGQLKNKQGKNIIWGVK